ncbi:unnamed protein product [Dracunculus medinensis]|uniref:Uncharacterized protein n=1 Tax=Dracunculus medinensis TaxID=318479 RepID=A0A0N4U718_DRAME|nr:unnamed protein product [Dracunculus medinensis]
MHQLLLLLLVVSVFYVISFEDESKVVCQYRENEPKYQPNIYLCSKGYSCCKAYGRFACCANDLNIKIMLEILKSLLQNYHALIINLCKYIYELENVKTLLI